MADDASMPWWVLLYLFVLLALCVGGLVDDVRDRRPAWWLLLAVLSGVASLVLVLAYWGALPAPPSPLLIAGFLAVALVYDTWSAWRDLRAAHDPSVASPTNPVFTRVGVALAELVMLPAYVWGVLAVMNQSG